MKFVSLLLCVGLFSLSGCASNPALSSAVKDAGSVIGLDTAKGIAAGLQSDFDENGKLNVVNLAFSAVSGLFSGVSQAQKNGDAATIINSFSNGLLRHTAAAAKDVPMTNQALAQVATIISTAAGAPPAQ